MHAARSSRFAALFLVATLLVVVAPAMASAAVFEDLWPAKGDYDFNDIVVQGTTVTPAGGVIEMGRAGMLTIPAGAASAATGFTWAVGALNVPMPAQDGGWVYTVVRMGRTDNLPWALDIPATWEWTAPSDVRNPRAYYYDPGSGVWVPQDSTPVAPKGGDNVGITLSHFSLYGIGGDPVYATPASSTWSLVIGVLVAVGLVAGAARTRRAGASL